jgi:TonB family protein
MNPSPAPLEPRWDLRRWLTVISVILALQLIGVFALSRSLPRPTVAANTEPRIRIAWSDSAETPALRMDPTLFALASEQGFSGVWLRRRAPEAHKLSDWSEAPQWLPAATGRLTRDFEALVRSNSVRQPTTRELPPPRTEAPEINRAPLPARSQVLLSGSLQTRGVAEELVADAWIGEDVLPDTIVQISVNATGGVLSTRLIQSCGLPAADQHALSLAAQARFTALPNGQTQITVGFITFRWSVTPPPPSTLVKPVP